MIMNASQDTISEEEDEAGEMTGHRDGLRRRAISKQGQYGIMK
jgi:hypothetical protein